MGRRALCLAALSAAGCSAEGGFVPWPADATTPWFVVTAAQDVVRAIHGPYSERSPPPALEVEETEEVWMVEPDLETLFARVPYLEMQTSALAPDLSERENRVCEAVRYDDDRRFGFVAVGEGERWRALDLPKSSFPSREPPLWSADLEWRLPIRESACADETLAFSPFGAEVNMFAAETVLPPGDVPAFWIDLFSVVRIDEDRVLAAADLALYLFRRGTQLRSVDGANTLPVPELLPRPIPEAIWSLRDLALLTVPVQRALFVLALTDATGLRDESVLVSVDLDGDAFGAFRPLIFADNLARVAVLDDGRYLAVGGRTLVVGSSSGTPELLELPLGWNAQRIFLAEREDLILLGSGNGFIWSGSFEALASAPIEPDLIQPPVSAVGAMAGIVGFASVVGEAGAPELWAATLRGQLLRRTAPGAWTPRPLEVLARPKGSASCLGPPGACGLVDWSARVRGLVPLSGPSFLVFAEECSEVLRHQVGSQCSARVDHPASESRLLGADRYESGLVVGGVGGLLLEAPIAE